MHHMNMVRCLILTLTVFLLVACAAPHVQTASNVTRLPVLTPDHVLMDDGYVLPLSLWRPEQEPRAVAQHLDRIPLDLERAIGAGDRRLAQSLAGAVLSATPDDLVSHHGSHPPHGTVCKYRKT